MSRLRSMNFSMAHRGTTLSVRIGGGRADVLRATVEDVRTAAHLMGAILLQAPSRRLPVGKAVSIAYLADRLSIMNFGHPVCESTFRNERCGPVNALVHGLTNGTAPGAAEWAEIITASGGWVALRGDITCDDLDELSIASWDAVSAAWSEAGRIQDADIGTLMQQLPEARMRTGADITEVMLAASGIRNPRSHLADAEDHRWLKRLLARTATIGNDTLDRAV